MLIRRSWNASALALATLAFALAPSASLFAQNADADVVQRLERQMRAFDSAYRLSVPSDQPIAERLLLDYGGTLRYNFLAVDAPQGDTRILNQYEAGVYLRAELDGAHRFYGRLRLQYNDWKDDSFDGRGDDLREPIGDIYWYQFDLRGALTASTGTVPDYNLNIRAGKQYVHWGSGLALSSKLFALLADAQYADIGFVGLVGLTPSGDTIDFDGSRPGFDSDTDRAFFGATVEYRGIPSFRPYAFALVQRDKNQRDFATFASILDSYPTRFRYDSEYFGVGARGTVGASWLYYGEFVKEQGENLTNTFDVNTALFAPQTTEDIDAWALIAGLSYFFRDAADSRIDFEFVTGSGDSDRLDSSDTFGGNLSGTDDTAFNALGYVNTGLALAPDPSNLLSFQVGYSTSPFVNWCPALADSRLGINGFIFAKLDGDAPINVATNTNTFVGGEIDLSFDWRITSDVDLNLRYGIFLPGDAMPDGQDDARHFTYAGFTYAF